MNYKWNPVFNLIMEVKEKYKNKFGKIKNYDFETWVNKLGIDKYTEFINPLTLRQHENMLLLKYNMTKVPKTFWTNKNSIYRECRSIVIDLKEESIVVAPWKKFFNLNETPENDTSKIKKMIDNAKNVEITNKLDGSMQTARYYNREIKLFGSQGLTPKISWRVKDGYKRLTSNHKRMIKRNPMYTFMFENISPKNIHVVPYSKEEAGLYLNGIRNVYTGRQLSYGEIKEIANLYNVPMVEFEDKTLDEIIQLSKEKEAIEKEGWVINIDGHLIKLKCDDYIELHKTIGKTTSPSTIIKHIAEDTFDDFISKVPKGHKDKVWNIHSKIISYIKKTKNKINLYLNKLYSNHEINKDNKKEVMIWVTENVPKKIQHYVRCEYLDKEYNLLKTEYGNNVKYIKPSKIGIREV